MVPNQRSWDLDLIVDIFNSRDKELIKFLLVTVESDVVTNVLPTADNLVRRRVDIMPTCSLCNAYNETVTHALLECGFAKSCWISSDVGVLGHYSSFLDWQELIFSTYSRENCQLAAMVCWRIWIHRNDRLWNHRNSSALQVLNSAGRFLFQWQNARKQPFLADVDAVKGNHGAVCWEKPCFGWLKCNVDAAIFKAQGKFSVGCVIREVQFSIVRRSANSAAHSVTRAEGSMSGELSSMESIPDLQESMYMVVDGYPCVRLLNRSGKIGCSNPGREKVVASIRRFRNANDLTQSTAVLVSLDELQDLLHRNDDSSGYQLVLVESGAEIRDKLKGFSPTQKFPQAEFAPYPSINYEWNSMGSGIMLKAYDFPVFLLSESSTSMLQEVADKNEKVMNGYTTSVAEFDLVMQTTKAGTHDSESCLKEQTCLPLGGYSVWSSLPPINMSSSYQSKPIILLVASMDSASFFRDKSLGADSPISVSSDIVTWYLDALSRVDGWNDLNKQLVFLVLTGEAWGYLGSRRFLHELDMQSDGVSGLNSSLIEMVSSAVNDALDALKRAQDSLKSENIEVLSSNSSNPGIPPSSLMAFLKKNSLTSGIVLEDFDTAFTNKFYHSHLDDMANINSSAVVAAASLIARSLYILASDNNDRHSSVLGAINVNTSLVEELMGCLLSCKPGLSCEMVKNYIAPANVCPSHYVGVVIGEPSFKPYLGYVDDVSRFVWNFLADRTSTPKENASSRCSKDCTNEDEVCIRAEINGKGVCVISTTRYVPAYSTRLMFESGTWNVLPPNSSDSMGSVDPVWTESNWNTIGLRVYTIQNGAYDHLILIGGITVTILAYFMIALARSFITKALKRD
ncbi:Nicastrin [Citrus sinensis]|nr:Nicastrin [Citrus sinensis]